MPQWVRTLSPGARVLVFAAFAISAFVLAAGVGAMGALMVRGDLTGLLERQEPRSADEQAVSRAQQKETAAERGEAAAEQKETAPQQDQAAAEQKETAPQQDQAAAEQKETAPQQDQAATEQKETAPQQDQAAANRSADAAQQAEAKYVDAVEDIQTNAVETFRNTHEKFLRYDALSAADVEEMKANEAALRGMAERAADLDPPQKYEEQHDVFSAAIDQLRAAAQLAHEMAADPVSATDTMFDEYDGHVKEAPSLLQQSNDLLGEDPEAIEGVREVSPEF